MARIAVDQNRCTGAASCVAISPDFFDQDDDGLVLLRAPYVGDDRINEVRDVVAACPTSAVILHEN